MHKTHTIYSNQLVQEICRLVAEFAISDTAAALSCRVSPCTLARWKRQLPDLEIRLRFAREALKAARFTISANARLPDGRPDPRPARWLLERALSARYPSNDLHQHGVAFGPN